MPTALGCSARHTGPDLCSELNRPPHPEDCDEGGLGLWGPRSGRLTGQRPGAGEAVTAGVRVTASPKCLLRGLAPASQESRPWCRCLPDRRALRSAWPTLTYSAQTGTATASGSRPGPVAWPFTGNLVITATTQEPRTVLCPQVTYVHSLLLSGTSEVPPTRRVRRRARCPESPATP